MAKIVFLTLAAITCWLLIVGNRRKKLRMIRVMILFFILMAVYAFFFPGVFAYTTSWDLLRKNFLIRAADFFAAMQGNILTEITLKNIEGDPHLIKLGGGHESGYAQIARMLPYLFIAVLVMFPLFRRGVKKLRHRFPELTDSTILMLFVLCLLPLITSFLAGRSGQEHLLR